MEREVLAEPVEDAKPSGDTEYYMEQCLEMLSQYPEFGVLDETSAAVPVTAETSGECPPPKPPQKRQCVLESMPAAVWQQNNQFCARAASDFEGIANR